MPEVAFCSARLVFQLSAQNICCLPVLFLSRLFIQAEKHTAFVDIIQIERLGFIGAYGAVFFYKPVNKVFGKRIIALVSGNLRHSEQCGNHTAVNVIPTGGFSLPHLLYIPNSPFRS